MQTIFFAVLVWSLFYSVASDLVCLIFARLKMRSQAFLGYTGSACVVASLWEIIKIPKQTSLKNNPAGLRGCGNYLRLSICVCTPYLLISSVSV